MTSGHNFLVLIPILVLLGCGSISSLADDQSGSSEITKLPSELKGADRELFQAVQLILSKDPEYNRLGYSDEQWKYLWTESTCLPRAMAIKHPDEGYELLYLNRPLLQLVVDINDLETTPKGTLLVELASRADQNKKLKNIYDYTATLLKVVSESSPLGYSLNLLKHAAEKTGELLKAQAAASSFDNVYENYKNERKNAPYQDPKAIAESMNLGTGAYRTDYSSIREFYLDLNKNANLGWDEKTTEDRILNELTVYLESRYKNDTGTLNPWDAKIAKPEDAIENQFRDIFHEMKVQLNTNLRELTRDCVNEMTSGTTSTGEQPNVAGGKGELVLDHLDAIATKYWNEGEGGTYIIFNKTNVDPGQRNFEAENDSSWDSGHFNMKLTTDIDLPDKVPIDDQGKYSFNGSVKASASWDSSGLGLSRTAGLDINGQNKGVESGIENRQVTLTNQSEINYSGKLSSSDEGMVANFNADAITYVERWVNPSFEIDIRAVYKLQRESQANK